MLRSYVMWACILLYVIGVIYKVKIGGVIRGDHVRRSVRLFVCDRLSVTKISDFCEALYRRSLQKLLSRLGFCENDNGNSFALLTGVYQFLPEISTFLDWFG
jgi:hypothetical protein